MKKIDNEKYFLDSGVKGRILLPLLLWLIISTFNVLKNDGGFLSLFFNPLNVVFGVLFFVFVIYHLHCEILYLINVYLSKKKYREYYKYIINIITYFVIFCVVLGILKIHFNSILVL